jgi:thioredoxin 1
MLAPILEELAADENGRLIVATVDVDSSPAVTNRHGVLATPTLLLFIDGEPRRRMVGARSKAQLRRDLEFERSATG